MSAPHSGPNSKAPVPVSERILLLDALRGFALLGVLLVHANHLAADVSIASPDAGVLINPELDRWVDRLVRVFVEEKAQTLFSVLFGISFAIQMTRLENRVDDAASVYRRRLIGLLAIGLLHVALLPAADILLYFALGGFALLFVRSWRTAALAGVGIVLALVAMPTASVLGVMGTGSHQGDTLGNLNLPALYQHGRYLEIMEMRWQKLWFIDHPLRGLLTLQVYVLGRLMMGVAVVRTGFLAQPRRYRRSLIWTAVIGLLGGLLLTESLQIERLEESAGWIGNPAFWRSLALYFQQAGTLLLAAGYAALFALAWQVGAGCRLLSFFSPIGRMAVTNYLLQSLFLSLVFYGFGLGMLGRLGSAPCFLLALGFFSLQCVFSRLWLNSYQFGPVEWLWRGWTYNKWPVLRRQPGA